MPVNDDRMRRLSPVYEAADFGRVVRALRRRRGWSQAELAEWLGVHRVTVAKLEQGGTVDLPLAIRALGVLGAMVTVHPRGVDLVIGGPG